MSDDMILPSAVTQRLEVLPGPAKAMVGIRSWFALTYLGSVAGLPQKSGYPSAQMTTAAKFLGEVFGIRELLMVAMVLYAAKTSPRTLRAALAASAAVDGFDTAAALVMATSNAQPRKAGLISAVTAATSCGMGAWGAASLRS